MKIDPDIAAAIQLLIANGYGVFRVYVPTANTEQVVPAQPQAYSVSEFCKQYGIARTHFYELQKTQRGPLLMKVGRRTLISREAAEEWARLMEAGR